MRESKTLPAERDLPHIVRMLESKSPAGGVLSVYLHAAVSTTGDGGRSMVFHDGCKAIRSQLGSAEREERVRFEDAVARVDAWLTERGHEEGPGVALFASGGGDLVEAALPRSSIDRVTWGERPMIEPLVAAIQDYQRIAVLLFDKEESRLFTIFLGEIEERSRFVDQAPGKQSTGDWFGLSQKRYERQRENFLLQHAKRTIRSLVDELQSHPFDRLLIGGPDEAVAVITHHLPRPLQIRLAGTLQLELFATDAGVLAAALSAAEEIERNDELIAIQSLIDDATTAHVTLGVETTLSALAVGRVNRLFVSAGFDPSGAQCESCGRLTTCFDECPECGGKTHSISNVGEAVIRLGQAEGARVEILSGDPSTLLLEHGGLGARTRY